MAYSTAYKIKLTQSAKKLSLLFASLLFLVIFTKAESAEQNARIAVLYPTSNTRVSQLFNNIIQSMKNHPRTTVQSRTLSADESVDDIQQWLVKQRSQAVVLLGKEGRQFSRKLSVDIPMITGAHMNILPERSAVSLAADPRQLFMELKILEPDVKRIHVIFNQANSGWLIDKARQAARINSVKLNAIQADNVQAAGQALKKLIDQVNAQEEAIWLTFDPVLPVKPLLPELLKKAWQKNLIIFSGNPYHVKQGTLFALFPDYSKLGQQMIELTLEKIKKNGRTKHEVSRYLNRAINIRTASHLGIHLTSFQVEHYKMVFPAE